MSSATFCNECGNEFDDNDGKAICKTCEDWIVKNRYQVICGNIGTVYDGNDMIEANKTYGEYKRQSESGYGRAAGESVTLFDGDDIKYDHIGTVDCPDTGE